LNAYSYKHGNEIYEILGRFFDNLSDYQLPKNFASWSEFVIITPSALKDEEKGKESENLGTVR
jgi:hypothetical protein